MRSEWSIDHLFVASSNSYADNILDRDRDDAQFVSAVLMLVDTTDHGAGLGRIAIGLGGGLLWWDEEVLAPVVGQVNWYPFARSHGWAGSRPERLAVVARFGALFGAWKPTTRGQLAGRTFTSLDLRYRLVRMGGTSIALNAGISLLEMRGPYTITEEGRTEDRSRAEFIQPQLGLSVAF